MIAQQLLLGLVVLLWLSSAHTADAHKPTLLPCSETQPGSNCSLTCAWLWEGSSPEKYEWKKDNVTMTGEEKSSLSLHNLTRSMEGRYQCRTYNASTAKWTASNPFDLRLITDPHKPTLLPCSEPLPGSNCSLSCTSLWGGSPALYEWEKDHVTIAGEEKPTLSLHSLTHSMEGRYQCRVLNAATAVWTPSDPIHLRLFILPEVRIEERTEDTPYRCAENSTLNLTCKVVNQPYPPVRGANFVWTFCPEGDVCATDDTSRQVRGGERLAIPHVTRQHSGSYTCQVNSSEGLKSSISSDTIHVEVLPAYLADEVAVVPQMGNKTLIPGDKVNLTCLTNSVPTANLTWLHQGQALRTVESNEDVYSFTVTGCQDSGEYQCRADNDAVNKSVSNKTRLWVECPPKLHSASAAKLKVKLGDNVTLTVTVTADPAPSFLWSGPGLSSAAAQSPSLALYSLQPQQAGLYTVTVFNKHGSLNHTFVLEVKEGAAVSTTVLALSIATALIVLLTCACALAYFLQDDRVQAYLAKKTKWRCLLQDEKSGQKYGC